MKILKILTVLTIGTVLVLITIKINEFLFQKTEHRRDVDQRERLKIALAEYHSVYGYYPSNLMVLASDKERGRWLHFIQKTSPLDDGLGHYVEYNINSNVQSFELKSPGPDGRYGTKDDLPPKNE